MDSTDSGKLLKTVKQLEEERSEIKNDFMIKFASFSEEIQTLKGRLSVYEKVEDDKQISSERSVSQAVRDSQMLGQNQQAETSVDYRAKYNLESTIDEGDSQDNKQ